MCISCFLCCSYPDAYVMLHLLSEFRVGQQVNFVALGQDALVCELGACSVLQGSVFYQVIVAAYLSRKKLGVSKGAWRDFVGKQSDQCAFDWPRRSVAQAR